LLYYRIFKKTDKISFGPLYEQTFVKRVHLIEFGMWQFYERRWSRK